MGSGPARGSGCSVRLRPSRNRGQSQRGGMMRRVRSSRVGHRWWVLVIALVLVVAGLTWGLAGAFAASPSPAPSSSAGQVVLKLGWTEEPDNLNVFVGYSASCWEIWALNYDYLFRCGNDNQPTLDLATQFPTKENGGISADGKVWTITIRSGVKFQDGTPLTAADVAFTYNYVIKNSIAQYTTYMDGITSAKALSPTTVQFTCAHSMASGYMETQSVPILPEHIWKNVSPGAATTSYGNKPPIIGSGPFEVVGYVKGSYIKMVRNPYYWGKKPTVDTIYFEVYQNADTMIADLRAGRIAGVEGDIPEGDVHAAQVGAGYQGGRLPLLRLGRPGVQLLQEGELARQPRVARRQVPPSAQLRDRQAAPLRPRLRWLRDAGYDRHAMPQHLRQPRLPLAAASQRGLHLRHRQSRPDAHRRRLPAQERRASEQAGQADRSAVGDAHEQDWWGHRGEADRGLAQAAWPQDLALGDRLRRSRSQDDQRARPKLAARFRSRRVGLCRQLRCRPDNRLLHDIAVRHEQRPTSGRTPVRQLAVQQAGAIDPQQRKTLIWRCSRSCTSNRPSIVLLYPDSFEAIDTTKWTGWTQLSAATDLPGTARATSPPTSTFVPRRPSPPRPAALDRPDRRHRRGRHRRRRGRAGGRAAPWQAG